MDKSVKVTMLGTGAPRPSLQRFQTSHLLEIDDLKIMVDCGDGATYQLMNAGVQPQEVEHLLLTHLHMDHVMGYGQFLIGGWSIGRRKLTVVGPKGTKKFHEGILELFKADIDYRLKLGRPIDGILDVNVIEIEEEGAVECGIPEARITVAEMIHNVLTYGYRFDTGDRTVVFSGDTAPTQAIYDLAKNANVLIQDAVVAPYDVELSPEYQKIAENLKKEHCSPAQVAEIAQASNVKKVVLTHFLDDVNVEKTQAEASAIFRGEVVVPSDLDVIKV